MGNPFDDDVEEPREAKPAAAPARARTPIGTRNESAGRPAVSGRYKSVRIECVCLGALMEVEFADGVSPREALEQLRSEDPDVKFRDAFPVKGGFGGNRATKTARVKVIDAQYKSDGGAFINLTCQDDEGKAIKVGVGKDHATGFVAAIEATAALPESSIAELRKAAESKIGAMIILGESEPLRVRYASTADGSRHFADAYEKAGA